MISLQLQLIHFHQFSAFLLDTAAVLGVVYKAIIAIRAIDS
jgi:hypothetical protein